MGIRYFNVAENGTPKSGTFDIVVFSHGIGGRYRNHYITAQAIADAGYIVVAPDHTADKMIGGPAMIGSLENRVGELQTAIDMVKKDTQLSTSNTIHGVGYSLGGKTIILASGAGEDLQILQNHCSENSFKDPQYCYYTNDKAVDDEKFCKSPEWEFTGQFNSFPPLFTQTCSNTKSNIKPFINGHSIVVAPAYQGTVINNKLTAQYVTIIAITGDTVIQPHFQTDKLYKAIKAIGTPVTHQTTAPAHHYAFMPLLPKRIRDEEGIPEDPPELDRLKIIDEINVKIIKVLNK